MSERIIGIDPGTIRMGYGLVENRTPTPSYVTCGSILGGRSLSLEQRLWKIYQGLLLVIDEFKPDSMAIEEPFVPVIAKSDGQYKTSVKSALAVGQAQAIALLVAASKNIPIFRYTPTQVKSTVTEYGRGSKEQVREVVCWMLGLGTTPESLDASDALAVALCHINRQNSMKLWGLP